MADPKKKKIRAQYTMVANVISTGEEVFWTVYDEPDYGGLQSGLRPSSLHGTHVQGAGKLRTGSIEDINILV